MYAIASITFLAYGIIEAGCTYAFTQSQSSHKALNST